MTSLSVIIPAKDVEPYIGDTLNSLIRNHRPDFEYIVVNDGSTDRTPEIVDSFRKYLPTLRMLHNSAPTGLSSVRNQGLAASAGEHITYLDGDDWLAPGYLPKAVSAIRHLKVDFIKTDHIQVHGTDRTFHPAPEGRVNRPLPPRSGILPINTASMVNYPFTSAGIYARRLAGKGLLTFNPAFHTCEDQPWAWRLHLRAESFARVPLTGLHYRRGLPGSLTQIGDRRQLHFFDAFTEVFDEVRPQREGIFIRAKAIRTFCATWLNHLDRKSRFSSSLQRKFVRKGVSLLRKIPQHELDVVLREMSGTRELRIRELLNGRPG